MQQNKEIDISNKDTSTKQLSNTIPNNDTTISEEVTEETTAYDITTEDCASKCENIKITKKKNYCNQICGFTTNTPTQSCDNLTDLEKDYCIQNQSIVEKDMNGCSQISDAGIKKQCQNRISEDFMDEVM